MNTEMTRRSDAKIFLAEERGCTQNENYRSYTTFNTNHFFSRYKAAFNNLSALNDDTLAAQQSINYVVEQNSYIIILPVVGGVEYMINDASPNIINAGSVAILNIPANSTLTYKNPLDKELINYIHFELNANDDDKNIFNNLIDFNLNVNQNKLETITNTKVQQNKFLSVSIGKFDGRQSVVHHTNKASIFAFIIQGVFEVEERLLHARDGLALNQPGKSIEFEALSNEAILLLLEW